MNTKSSPTQVIAGSDGTTYQKGSRTALATANMRAAHQIFDESPRVFEDPLALSIIGPAAAQRIMDTKEHYQTDKRRGFRAHIIVRSRFAEDRLALAVSRGVSQYVILGAGFDTFVLRQPEWARGIKILEVDQPSTQSIKRSRLAEAGLDMPANAAFADIDFKQESLSDGLFRHGISKDKMTFFSCLGVIMYLHEAEVDSLLGCVTSFPTGSEIVLTYASPAFSRSHLAERARSVGEPWLSFFEPESLRKKLHDIGFSETGLFPPEEARERYFRHQPGNLPVPPDTNIVYAVK